MQVRRGVAIIGSVLIVAAGAFVATAPATLAAAGRGHVVMYAGCQAAAGESGGWGRFVQADFVGFAPGADVVSDYQIAGPSGYFTFGRFGTSTEVPIRQTDGVLPNAVYRFTISWHSNDGSSGAAVVNLTTPVSCANAVGISATSSGRGYVIVDSWGATRAFGDANRGALECGVPCNGPTANAVSVAVDRGNTRFGQSSWVVHSDGQVVGRGVNLFDANVVGALAQPLVGAVSTLHGGGLWLVASDGGVFTYGNARFFGSAGALRLNRPIVGIAATPSGHGYWLVASDGGVFTFGDARFFGSAGALRLSRPIVGAAAMPNGRGYWLLGSDGGIFSFGDAKYYGSLG